MESITEKATRIHKQISAHKNFSYEWCLGFIAEWEEITKKLRRYDLSRVKLVPKAGKEVEE